MEQSDRCRRPECVGGLQQLASLRCRRTSFVPSVGMASVLPPCSPRPPSNWLCGYDFALFPLPSACSRLARSVSGLWSCSFHIRPPRESEAPFTSRGDSPSEPGGKPGQHRASYVKRFWKSCVGVPVMILAAVLGASPLNWPQQVLVCGAHVIGLVAVLWSGLASDEAFDVGGHAISSWRRACRSVCAADLCSAGDRSTAGGVGKTISWKCGARLQLVVCQGLSPAWL